MRDPVKPWSMKSAIEQINSVPFECEAGHLQAFDAWAWLNVAAKEGPEFWPGQWVWHEVTATVAGQTISSWKRFCIVGCYMDSDTDRTFFKYSLSSDPPGPWHFGQTHAAHIRGDALRLECPVNAA